MARLPNVSKFSNQTLDKLKDMLQSEFEARQSRIKQLAKVRALIEGAIKEHDLTFDDVADLFGRRTRGRPPGAAKSTRRSSSTRSDAMKAAWARRKAEQAAAGKKAAKAAKGG